MESIVFEGTTLNYSHDGSESTADYIEYQVDDGN